MSLSLGAGMRPCDFWEASFDECMAAIKGRSYGWRVQRMIAGAMMKFQGGKEVNLMEDIPLMFDSDLSHVNSDDLIAEYKALKMAENGG